MGKKLSIELQEHLIRFILSSHKKSGIEILEVFETNYGSENEEPEDGVKKNEDVESDLVSRGVVKILEIVKEKKWDKINKVLLYNMGDLDHIIMDVPLVPDDEMEELLLKKLETEKNLQEKEVIAFKTMGTSDSKGMRGVYVQKIPQELLEKLSLLKLKGIDFEVFAANRLESKYVNKSENIGFVDLRNEYTTISIYLKEELTLFRKIGTGKKDFIEELSRKLEISMEEAEEVHSKYLYVDEKRGRELIEAGESRGLEIVEAYATVISKLERKIFQYIDYFQFRNSGEVLKAIYFEGISSRKSDVEDYIKKTFAVDNVFELNLLSGIKSNKVENIEKITSTWSLLFGTMESKNGAKFIGKTLKLPFKVKKNPLYIAIAIIFVMIMVSKYGYYKLQELDQLERLKTIELVKKSIESDVEEYDSLQTNIKEVKNEINYLGRITGKSTIFNNFLTDLSYKISSQLYIEEIKYSKDKVSLSGKAVSNSGYSEVVINQLVRDLEEISESVKLIRTSKISTNGLSNDFLIEVVLIGGEVDGN